jgi:signal transduction histidine kinase
MRRFLARLKPDSLAARFVWLLAGALIAANCVAFLVLGYEGRRFDRAAQDAREVERTTGLVAALQSVEQPLWRTIIASASNRFVQVKIDNTPVVTQSGSDARALEVRGAIAAQLPGQQVLVAQLPRFAMQRDVPRDANKAERGRRMGALLVSVQFETAGRKDKWLNIISYEAARNAGIGLQVLLTTLGLSLISVLGVGLLFVRQLVRPLSALAKAAEAAGRGDRTARVPVEGAREFRNTSLAFNDMQAKIAGFDAERMRTLGAVGHDLRTPITGLRIRAEMLDDEDTRNAFVRTLDDMTVMADGLVTFAKGTREAEEPVALDLAPFLEELCKTRGAVFAGGGQAKIRARPVALGRAIGNLIDNALRYGGFATVRLETTRNAVFILVEDDGPGIAPERLEAMFEPFVRGEDSRNAETGGAGLGLSIVRSIIQAHGGAIVLENILPKGLRAKITLPLV